MTSGSGLRPVLKWAGGKRRLVPKILDLLPEKIGTYYEPFVGGAAVFFALARAQRFQRAVLADRNPELIAVYEALQTRVEDVIRALSKLEYDHDQYYRIRSQRPRGLVQRAVRIIYLNKTGYNGLYRVNRAGDFNVPFGRHKRPKICDPENLRAAASALQGVKLVTGDFEKVCSRARSGDAVYFDPPYLPMSATSSFAAYNPHPFGVVEHERLAAVFARLKERGVCGVLSNSCTKETRRLFGKFDHRVVPMKRPINSKASRRGVVPELLAYVAPADKAPVR